MGVWLRKTLWLESIPALLWINPNIVNVDQASYHCSRIPSSGMWVSFDHVESHAPISFFDSWVEVQTGNRQWLVSLTKFILPCLAWECFHQRMLDMIGVSSICMNEWLSDWQRLSQTHRERAYHLMMSRPWWGLRKEQETNPLQPAQNQKFGSRAKTCWWIFMLASVVCSLNHFIYIVKTLRYACYSVWIIGIDE